MYPVYVILTFFSLPEWIIFLIYFSSIYTNVYLFPEKSSSKHLPLFIICVLFCVRCFYFIFYFLAIPYKFLYIDKIQRLALYVLTSWWYLVLCIPALFSLYYLFVHEVGDIKEFCNTSKTYKKVICVLPVYNEEIELLKKGLDSLFNLDYPEELLEVHISFDDDNASDLYLKVLDYFNIYRDSNSMSLCFYVGRSLVYIHRFKHGGKKHTQMNTWNIIKSNYSDIDTSEYYILLTDSDNILKKNALHNFTAHLYKNPSKIAYCGYMSCISSSWNFIAMIQDVEYVSCEINRFFELKMGTVNCLPGAFTIIRYNSFKKVSYEYFEDFIEQNITHFHQRTLGEDRYLTHLIHKIFPRNSLGFCPSARCKTDPPRTLFSFVKQRRRWLLSSMSNEAYMLSTPVIWNKYPFLMLYKLIQTSWRSTSCSQLLVASFGLFTTIDSSNEEKRIFLLSVLIPIAFTWFVSICYAYKLQHYKVVILWPFMILFYTIMYIFIDWYAIFTWSKKTWGGSRIIKNRESSN